MSNSILFKSLDEAVASGLPFIWVGRRKPFIPPAPVLPENFRGPDRFRHAVRFICDMYEVTPDELLGRSRSARVAWPRHHLAWICIKRFGYTYPFTAKLIGGRDHTTIINSVRRYQSRIDAEEV